MFSHHEIPSWISRYCKPSEEHEFNMLRRQPGEEVAVIEPLRNADERSTNGKHKVQSARSLHFYLRKVFLLLARPAG